MPTHLRSRLTALVSGLTFAALAIGAAVVPASAILMDDTGLLGRVGPHLVARAQFVPLSDDPFHTGDAYSTGIPDQYVVQSDDLYHTGDAYSTGTSLQARQAWQPSPAVTTMFSI